MKYDKSDVKEQLRGMLAFELQKQGHTLEDLENNLTVEKQALELPNIKDVSAATSALGRVYLGSAAVTGALGGLGLYGAYKGMKDTNDRLEESEAVKARIIQAQRELETAILAKKLQEQNA